MPGMATDAPQPPQAWTTGERILTFLGGLLVVVAVGNVLGAIASGPGRDPGWGNFATTSMLAVVGVVIGVVGGLVLRFARNHRTGRGVVLAD